MRLLFQSPPAFAGVEIQAGEGAELLEALEEGDAVGVEASPDSLGSGQVPGGADIASVLPVEMPPKFVYEFPGRVSPAVLPSQY